MPNRWYRRGLPVLALARAGEYNRAAAEARAAAEDPQIDADNLFGMARAVALSIRPVRADARLAVSEREAVAERYASQAMAVLRKLQARGSFQDAGHAEQLKTAAELKPLRGRLDFQLLLLGVGKKGEKEEFARDVVTAGGRRRREGGGTCDTDCMSEVPHCPRGGVSPCSCAGPGVSRERYTEDGTDHTGRRR